MKLHKVLIAATAATSFLMLAACGKSSSSSSSGADSKTITFWNPMTGGDLKNVQAMVNEYNKTKPAYKVKNVSMQEADMYTKIPTVVNSGKNIPDLTIVHAERIQLYKDDGMLTSYDKQLKTYPEIKGSNYVSEAWNMGQVDGKTYGVPLDIHTAVMYYNKDLVKKYAPHALDDNVVTYDEVKAAGAAAKKDGIQAIGVTWQKPLFMALMSQYGGSISKDGKNPSVNSDAAKKALSTWSNMRKDGITTKDGQDPLQQFTRGKLIFYPEGIWVQNQVKKANFEWGMTNEPQLSPDINKAVNWSSSHQFVMFKSKDRNAAKEKATVKFVNWVRTHSQEWAKSGQNPASLAIKSDKAYQKMPQSMFLTNPQELKTLKIFKYKYNGFVSDAIDKYILDGVFGKTSVNDTVNKIQDEAQAKVDQDRANAKQ
ncbi:extracellular solute-binding protein [Lacticaseibacillus sp. GG6-2]